MLRPDDAEELLRRMVKGAMAVLDDGPPFYGLSDDQRERVQQALLENTAEVINVHIGVQ